MCSTGIHLGTFGPLRSFLVDISSLLALPFLYLVTSVVPVCTILPKVAHFVNKMHNDTSIDKEA